jgi:hypothetical protein
MLALISLSCIRTSAPRHFAYSDLIDIASTTSEIKDFLFVGAIFTDSSLPVDQKHALSFDTSQSLKIGQRWFLTETLETLLFWFFTFTIVGSLWLGFFNV